MNAAQATLLLSLVALLAITQIYNIGHYGLSYNFKCGNIVEPVLP